jgi:hypothetical protein
MPAPYSGRCSCAATRYFIGGEPKTLYACHCTDCQRRTGAAFALSLVVSRDAVTVPQGKTLAYSVTLADGRIKRGQMCSTCGTRLWGEPLKLPGMAIVQPGTLDDTSWLRPVAHIWTRSAQPWFPFPNDVPLYETQPPPGELVRLWQQRKAA